MLVHHSEGEKFAPTLGGISEKYFSDQQISSISQRCERLCLTLEEFTVVCNIRGDNW